MAPLTIIVAPAGFGKTTLIRTWHADATENAAAASFDTSQQTNALDVGLVLADAAGDLGVSKSVLEEALGLIQPDGLALGRGFIHTLGDALRVLADPFICSLDDVQVLPDEISREVGGLISSVVDDRHRFVAASRRVPPWPVARWRVNGFADLVEADQLRLTSTQIEALLGSDLAHHVPRVVEVTGGWAAAVEAVRWRLKVAPTLVVADVARDLIDYVMAEVLPVLPPAEIRTLCQCSILQTFPVSVAVAVTEDRSAAQVLDEVHQQTSLVTRFADGTYRYHPILQEALRQGLERSEPERWVELHARAGEAWLDEPDSYGALVNAADHLLEARAWSQVLDLLKRRVRELDMQGRLDLAARWMDAIPGEHWRDDADLVLLYGWANQRIGKTGRAVEALHNPVFTTEAAVGAVGALLHAAAVSWDADPVEAIELCEHALPELRALDAEKREGAPEFPGVDGYELAAHSLIGMAYCVVGRFADAVVVLDGALRSRHRFDPIMLCALMGSRGWAQAMLGDVAAARSSAQEALQVAADAEAATRHELTVPALLAMAVAESSTGDAVGARELVHEAAARCQQMRMAHLLQMCDLVGAMCGIADSLVAEVEPPLTASSLPLAEQFTVPAAARGQAQLGDAAGAERTLRTVEPHELALSAWVEVLLRRVERRRVHRWVSTLPAPTCLRARIVRLLVEAATTEPGGDRLELVRQAADLAAPEGLIGMLLDAPAQLWERVDLDHESHPMLLDLGARRRGAEADPDRPSMTSRELEVLRLLPYVSSMREVAERLYVSIHTAKWHRANIYRKLGAARREEAVARAIELGLIDPSSTRPQHADLPAP